jgi:hypothetical protein
MCIRHIKIEINFLFRMRSPAQDGLLRKYAHIPKLATIPVPGILNKVHSPFLHSSQYPPWSSPKQPPWQILPTEELQLNYNGLFIFP